MSAALDVDRFRKVQALAREGSTPGERMAAHARVAAIAQSAGLTVLAAAKLADKVSAPKPQSQPAPPTSAQTTVDAFNAIFNTPEARAHRNKREVKRQARCRELLEEYGSEDAVFADTSREAALRAAVAPFVVWDQRPDRKGLYKLAGWDELTTRETMPAAIREAVSSAWPIPSTVTEAWAEYVAADKLGSDRDTMADGYFTPHAWEDARRYVIEDLCDMLPARDFADVLARISWMDHLNDQGWNRDIREDAKLLATLRADVERLSNLSIPDPVSTPVQTGQAETNVDNINSRSPRTAADRRRAVLSMLDAPETATLPDREMARRVGVSPTTVGSLRRRKRHDVGFVVRL